MNALRFLSRQLSNPNESRPYKVLSWSIVLLLLSMFGQGQLYGQSITCQANVEVGFGPWCKADLSASQYVNNPVGEYTFQIVGTDISGTLPLEIQADDIVFNQAYNYTITNSGGVTCDHGNLTFRDYSPPFCGTFDPIVTAYCTAEDVTAAFTGPMYSDCSSFTVSFTDVEEDNCFLAPHAGMDVVKKITRSWTAIDSYGNQTTVPCTQELLILSPDIDDIVADATVNIICDKNIPIEDAIHPDSLPIEAIPHINVAGDLQPITSLCKYAIVKTDSDPVPYEGNQVKVFRTWQITNWCTTDSKIIQQTLVFVDEEAPELSVEPMVTIEANIFSDDPFKLCEGIGSLPMATATDNCSEDENIEITIYIPHYGATIPNGGVLPLGLPYGDNEVIYTAKDESGEETSQTVIVKVVDTTKPVALCTPAKNVGITDGSTTVVLATEFENGSIDNCCIDRFEVRRADAIDGDLAFDHHVEFGCDDDKVTVIFRAYDCAGNFNNCTLEVTVQDLIIPTITPPASAEDQCMNVVNVDLTDIDILQERYGVPTMMDNCPGAYFVELQPVITDTDCSGQEILRSFTGFDDYGNEVSETVYQLVEVEGVTHFEVTFPENIEVDCADAIPVDNPVVTNLGCGELFSRYEDIIYNQDQGACYKIIRTWEILDWCAFDVTQTTDGEEVVDMPSLDGLPYDVTDGYIKYVQEIRVTDNEAPVITSVPDDIVVELIDGCEASVAIPAAGFSDNNCNGNAHITAEINGLSVAIGSTITGTHGDEIIVKYQAIDGCQNYSEIVETKITFIDNKKPTPVCLSLSTELGSGGTVLIWANDFESGSSYDNCGLTDIHRINKIIDADGDNNYIEDVIDTPPTATSLTFTCADIGNQYVQYWIQDDAGNWEFCVTAIFITDADDDDCGTETASVAGYIQTAEGEHIEQVEVLIDDPAMPSFFTAFDGFFNFLGLGSNQEYTVTPKKDIADDNGISTFDMVMMQRHILGVSKLTSPYLMLAADVNNSGSISTGDMLELRRLILGVNDDLTKTESWKFIPADYIFADPQNPFSEPVPESITTMSGSEVQFVGYKMGDLNLNANTANILEDDTPIEEVVLHITNQQFDYGDRVAVQVNASQAQRILGLGLDVGYDDSALIFEGIESSTLSDISSDMYHDQGNQVRLAWTDAYATSLDAKDEIITLVFTALANSDIQSSTNWSIEQQSTVVVEEGAELIEKEITINYINPSSEIKLYQNQPNPFMGETMIRFDLPKSENISLEVMDISGRIIYQMTGDFPKGENQVLLNAQDLPDAGVYYYRLSSGDFIETKKLIYIKS